MLIALLSDMHGNLVAFETVLSEIARESVDQIICLGDVGALGPQPREVLARLRDLGCDVVLGNTDQWLLTPPVAPADDEDFSIVCDIAQWCSEQLSQEDRAYIQTFHSVLELPLDEGRWLVCYHGSPRSYNDVISATTPEYDLETMLDGFPATVMVGGHTHIQMFRRYGDVVLLNVGSIGLAGVTAGTPDLPPNHNVHWAEYGMLSIEAGRLNIELRRTPLDMPAVLASGTNSGMPHVEWWLQKWERN